MAVFRINKTHDYTVMSNHHLKDKNLTLKAKGLLSMMLSLPEEWNYTTRGLVAICKEGVDSIGSTLRELENEGYIIRRRLRDDKGKITDTEYTIYERPQKPDTGKPNIDKPGRMGEQQSDFCSATSPDTPKPYTPQPHTEKPYMDEPDTDEPYTENTAQLNTNQTIPKKSITHGLNIHQSIRGEQTAPIPNRNEKPDWMDRIDEIETYRSLIMENIEYDCLSERYTVGFDELNELAIKIRDMDAQDRDKFTAVLDKKGQYDTVSAVISLVNYLDNPAAHLPIQVYIENVQDNSIGGFTMGGCSDDGFDYFRGWLTAQGKDVFMNALADPESLAEVKAVKVFGRETHASFYTPLKGYYEKPRFGSMLSVAVDAYEHKTGRDFYEEVDKHPLSKQEKADIASGVVYAEDIDVKWRNIDESWIETNAAFKEMLPKLHALFNGHIDPEVGDTSFSIIEKVCANTPDGRHMLIIQAYNDDTRETIWAIGDDQVCAITSADCIRNDIPYNSVLIKEFPYQDHSLQSVGKWRAVIEALVEATAESYLKHDGIFHIYPQWLSEEAYLHLGKELFNQMAKDCDHIILRDNNTMDFVPKNAEKVSREKNAENNSIIDKIRQSKQSETPKKSKTKKHDKSGPEH